MNDTNTIAIPISLLLLFIFWGWLIVGLKGRWFIKLALITTSAVSTLFVLSAMSSLYGWATRDRMPDKFLMKWNEVEPPNKRSGFPGSIKIWLGPYGAWDKESKDNFLSMFEYKFYSTETRLYQIPYTREMHEKMEKAKGRLKQGKPVVGERGNEGGKDGKEKGQGKNKGGLSGLIGKLLGGQWGRPIDENNFNFYEGQPPGHFPDKDAEE
jgi:hypothetical protein